MHILNISLRLLAAENERRKANRIKNLPPGKVKLPIKIFTVSMCIILTSFIGTQIYDYHMETNYGIIPPSWYN